MKGKRMTVGVFDETGKLPENLFRIIEKTALKIGETEGLIGDFSVDILITDPENIMEINRSKRKINKVTDVLSFPMLKGEIDKKKPAFLGDIVICLDTLLNQALEYGHSNEREAGFLTAHGMLHLLGYDHMNDEEEKIMFLKQEEILRKLGITRVKNEE